VHLVILEVFIDRSGQAGRAEGRRALEDSGAVIFRGPGNSWRTVRPWRQEASIEKVRAGAKISFGFQAHLFALTLA
jgi:hypothetical protein